jgi:hypothetical protein
MQLGGLAGLTALTMGLGQEQTKREKDGDPAGDKIPVPTPEGDLLPVLRAEAMAAQPSAGENGSLIKTLR